MELIQTRDHYVLLDGEHSLWCNRITGEIIPRHGTNLHSEHNPTCLGHIYGVIGKIKIHPELPPKLIIIKHQNPVGVLPGGHRVYNISKIALVNLVCSPNLDVSDLNLEACRKCYLNKDLQGSSNKALNKVWNAVKRAASPTKSHKKPPKEKFEKRIAQELIQMFTDTNFFYYSPTGDITNSLQRQYFQSLTRTVDLPLWQRVDQRFFWNKYMLRDLIESKNQLADRWIIPVLQGFVQIENCVLNNDDQSSDRETSDECKILLISRRSRDRAGTRYKRRGIDESGKCANYVETEQIIEYLEHCLSFVQVRGSIPVFWSQPGYKYRPPPLLDKDEIETQIAFEKHFEEELSIYDYQTIINLVEQVGREKLLADAYLNHVLNYNSTNLAYVSFDFHHHCRGMRFDNVKVLISNIEDVISDLWYCWIDNDGLVCDQKGVFRVNCLDCLDRTNVVQTAFAKAVLEIQFSKLNLLPAIGMLPLECRNTFQMMWANNGDVISRQYAGTVALKGDFTRTGERRLVGAVKDGYYSANRYYLNAFRDGYRQACFDILQGKPPNEKDMTTLGEEIFIPLSALLPEEASTYYDNVTLAPEVNLMVALVSFARYLMNQYKKSFKRQSTMDLMLGHFVSDDIFGFAAESEVLQGNVSMFVCQAGHIYHLIEDCKKIFASSDEIVLGAWAVIDADPEYGDPAQQEMNIVLIVTKDSYYVAEYEDESDRITQYQRVLLSEIETIELGPEPSIFQSKYVCFRINYQLQYESGYFHMFRSANTRFFNNRAIPIESEKDALDFLGEIVTTFSAVLQSVGLKIPFHRGKLERRKSRGCFQEMKTSPFSDMYLALPSMSQLNKSIRGNPIHSVQHAGIASTAFSYLMSQLSKFRPPNQKPKKPPNNAELEAAKGSCEIQQSCSTSNTPPILEPLESKHNFLLSSCGILAAGLSQSTVPTSAPQEDRCRPTPYPRLIANMCGFSDAKLPEIHEESKSEVDCSKISDSSDAVMILSNTASDLSSVSQDDGLAATGSVLQDLVVPGFCQFASKFQSLASNLGSLPQPAVPDVGSKAFIADAQLAERKKYCLTRIIEL